MDDPLTPEQVLNFRARQGAADKITEANALARGQIPQELANAFTDAFQAQFNDTGPTDVAVL